MSLLPSTYIEQIAQHEGQEVAKRRSRLPNR
jgi:hypothetical protein